MGPFEPQPPSDPSPALAEPAIDDPPRLEASEAFAIGRAIGSGVSALKRAPMPMLLAGFLMALLDGSNGGNFGGNGGGGGGDGYDRDYDDYSGLLESVGAPVRLAVSDTLGDVFTPVASLLQLEPDLVAIAAVAAGMMLCVLAIVVVFWVARSFVRPGVIRLHSHILQTAEKESFGVIFSGSDRFVAMLLWELLSGVLLLAVTMIAMAPAGVALYLGATSDTPPLMFAALALFVVITLPVMAYVGLGLSLGAHAVTLENRSPVEALRRSWTLASGNRLRLLLFFFVVALVQLVAVLVGVLLCCVGLLVTIPAARAITDFALTESFLLLTRGREVSRYWALWELMGSGVV